jgi:hypothetical protein
VAKEGRVRVGVKGMVVVSADVWCESQYGSLEEACPATLHGAFADQLLLPKS